jgi:hypothetical protein
MRLCTQFIWVYNGLFEHGKETSSFIEGGKFVKLSNYQLPKDSSYHLVTSSHLRFLIKELLLYTSDLRRKFIVTSLVDYRPNCLNTTSYSGSNLAPNTDYPDLGLRGSSQSLLANAEIVP